MKASPSPTLVVRLLVLAIVAGVLATCTDSRIPTLPQGEGPLFAIIDGAHGGNPDFFFLPPLVSNPTGDMNFGDRPFNADLAPNVIARICELDPPMHDPNDPDPNPPDPVCTSEVVAELTLALDAPNEQYVVSWTPADDGVTETSPDLGIQIFVGGESGSEFLGRRDVDPGPPPASNCADKDFCNINPRQSVEIKVRIESAALCIAKNPNFNPDPAAKEPCVSQTGTPPFSVTLTGSPAIAVTKIPDQAVGPTTITMQFCADLNPRAIDLRTAGPCVESSADPPLRNLSQAAIIQLCNIQGGLTPAQEERLVVHQHDANENVTIALPTAEAADCPEPAAPENIGSGPLERLFRFASAQFWALQKHIVAMLRPDPLWATLCDPRAGCSGSTSDFTSSFQSALPTEMNYVRKQDASRSTRAGTTTQIQVKLTDVEGLVVERANVSFRILPGGVGELSTLRDESNHEGIAEVTLTVCTNLVVEASGRGIAGPGDGGPFVGDTEAVTLGTGTLLFEVKAAGTPPAPCP